MSHAWKFLCWSSCAVLSVAASGCCSFPMTRTFGVADNFSMAATNPDPIPYNPALPSFVAFLNAGGVTTASMKTFDDQTTNRHMVATLRHGLRSCFASAVAQNRTLSLCFTARAVNGSTGNDAVNIYDTNMTTNTFTQIASTAIAPPLIANWTPVTTALLCINLTPQMASGQIGDVLQFVVQDDTAVDSITMTIQ